MKDKDLDRHVRDMKSVHDSLVRDPVKYGVPRSLFKTSIDVIEQLRRERDEARRNHGSPETEEDSSAPRGPEEGGI